ncbi:hypothetical protein AY481_11770 [Corynebacterium diphtheriae bv. mitis]|nr:hypothetical protein BKD81_10520 [Corynebacterium diphtheriae]OWM97406.1 hypothetical protein AY481_11770 [Corynebacterium diphtheriae bv. mitis]
MINQNNHVVPDTQQRTNTHNKNKHTQQQQTQQPQQPHTTQREKKPSWVTRIHPDKKQKQATTVTQQ